MPKRSDWLDDELARVTWKGFHVVRPYTGPLREDLPPSYAALAARVGAARLYLSGRTHQIMIVCPPEEDLVGDVPVLRVGVANDSDAYLVVSELAAGRDVRVYEAFDGELEPTGPTFGGWLAACADEARREYSADDWARLERGPEPFTAEELALLEARRKLEWRFTGGGPEGTLRFVIRNRSSRRVKALTVGVRAKGRRHRSAPADRHLERRARRGGHDRRRRLRDAARRRSRGLRAPRAHAVRARRLRRARDERTDEALIHRVPARASNGLVSVSPSRVGPRTKERK